MNYSPINRRPAVFRSLVNLLLNGSCMVTLMMALMVVALVIIGGQPLAAQEAQAGEWKYDADLLRPFWIGRRMEGESVLFIRDSESGEARASVLFPIEGIVAVRNSAGTMTYQEGLDYQWKKGERTIVLPKGSRITSSTPQELRRPAKSQKYELTHRDGHGEIFFGGRLEYHDLQTCITYNHEPNLWKSNVPKFDARALPRTLARLRTKQPVSVVILGDSISSGCNASGWANAAPFQPAYPELFRQILAERFQTPVTLSNPSVSGRDTAWALTIVDRVTDVKPNLVVLAFGMNDSAGRPAAEYLANTKQMIEKVRKQRPEVEFILVATMLGNRDWTRLQHDLFPQYRDSLLTLTSPGVAVADLTSIWQGFLELKKDWDQTGNGVNHPNDFGHRVYAQALGALLTE
jgi:acyl-CoA thioesterase-1